VSHIFPAAFEKKKVCSKRPIHLCHGAATGGLGIRSSCVAVFNLWLCQQFAIENGHFSWENPSLNGLYSGFSHEKWPFSMANC
jgi:hypothetical protein